MSALLEFEALVVVALRLSLVVERSLSRHDGYFVECIFGNTHCGQRGVSNVCTFEYGIA